MEEEKSHLRTIIHIDIDCFYAQVELQSAPNLVNEPIGIKQKNIVVTCNYVARQYGIKKCMLIADAMKLCPKIILFNGEDLYKYRQASNQIHSLLKTFVNDVEKLGFDENYLDVTELVAERLQKNKTYTNPVGHYIGNFNNACSCGCHVRLVTGSEIAFEIRQKLKRDLDFTSCCGISYNKLLAKIACSAHKPNQQTIMFPNGAIKYLSTLGDVAMIPGIGFKTKESLLSINIKTVKDLQAADIKALNKVFKNEETAMTVKNLSIGICTSSVKKSSKPLSLGLECGAQKISLELDVKQKFENLLHRLLILVEEDGRIPNTVKVTIRKQGEGKIAQKETKQSPVSSSLFTHPISQLKKESINKLLNIIMDLFKKIVNVSRPFHVTLLGLSFSKFHEKHLNSSIASFLLKKGDLSVQSTTNLKSIENFVEAVDEKMIICSKVDSDSEVEPSPKKPKLDVSLSQIKLEEEKNVSSPSKLKVESLNLNEDLELTKNMNIDQDTFNELPYDIQQEIIREYNIKYLKMKHVPCSKQSLITSYCISNH